MTTLTSASLDAQHTRTAALIGIAGPVVFTVGWITAGAVQQGKYSVARHDISDMGAVGVPHAWILLTAHVVAGLCTLFFVVRGLHPALRGTRGATLSATLVAVMFGIGHLTSAAFRLDCRIADGCSPGETTSTWHGIAHAATAVVCTFLVGVAAPFVVARCLRRAPRWQNLARTCTGFGVALTISMVVYLGLDGRDGAGFAQRTFAVLLAAWVAVLALHLLALSGRPVTDSVLEGP
jgi:hypothetical membrane protein